MGQNDLLVLLACLGDSQFDLRPYLRGLKGRFHTPWYLTRFFRDLESLSSESLVLTESFDQKELIQCELMIEQQKCFARSYRHNYFSARTSSRPERFIFFLLEMVEEFYQFYAYPGSRVLLQKCRRKSWSRGLSGMVN